MVLLVCFFVVKCVLGSVFERFFQKMRIFSSKHLVVKTESYTFASQLRNATYWTFSSAGLEHLPYKQRVGGSNPSTSTLMMKYWTFSSAGLEHLPYKQRVGGSNPSTSTKKEPAHCVGYFFLRKSSLSGCLMCPVQGAVCGKLSIYCEKVIKLNTLLINFMSVMSVYG